MLLFSPILSNADTLFNLNVEYSGGAQPAGPAPWLSATFADTSAGTVTLTLSASRLTGSEFVGGTTGGNPQNGWYFNFDPTKDLTKLNFTPAGGNSADNIYKGTDLYSAGPDGNYDILFVWRPPGAQGTLSAGEGAVYTITYTGGSLEASWFDYPSATSGPIGPYRTAAHIQGIAQGSGSGWIGDGPPAVPAVPEPATMLLLGSGLIGLAGFARRRFKIK